MFFVSEEFLRKYQEKEEINQTIGDAVQLGEELFDNTGGKRKHNEKKKRQTKNKSQKTVENS